MAAPDVTRAVWRKSTRSGANDSNCVEVAELPGAVAVRDSKNPNGPALIFDSVAWSRFVGALDAVAFKDS